MAQDSAGEKTEKATPRRLRDARRKGQVAKSQELASALSLVSTLLVVIALVPWCARLLAGLQLAVERSLATPTREGLVALCLESLKLLAAVSIAPVSVAAFTATSALWLQVGPIFSLDLVEPKLERLNPASGLQKLFSTKSLVTFMMLLAKTLVIGIAVVLVVRQLLPDAIRVIGGDTRSATAVARTSLMDLLAWCGAAFIALGAADFAYQRWQHAKDMRMSMSEVRRESREDEGDHHVKSERRRASSEPSAQELLRYMAQASLVMEDRLGRIVAIVYRPRVSPTPLFLMRGSGELAQRALAIARAKRVFVVADHDLVMQIYPGAATGTEPSPGAVARMLGHLERLHRNPEGSRRTT